MTTTCFLQQLWTAEDFKPYKDIQVLDECLRKRLKLQNIYKLFRFQWSIFKYLKYLDRNYLPGDLIIQAPTGTGKTLCYVLPLLQALRKRTSRPCLRALVIVPTRELVHQLSSVFQFLADETGLKIVGFSGDSSISSERFKALETLCLLEETCHSSLWKIDILISTPGRLVDHINHHSGFKLNTLEFLVLDETDRLMTGQSLEWVENILRQLCPFSDISEDSKPYSVKEIGLKRPLRKLLFSATQTNSVSKLTNLFLVNPALFTYGENEVAASSTLENSSNANRDVKRKYWLPFALEEFVLLCKSPVEKLISLIWYLEHLERPLLDTGVLVFASSKTSVHRLFRFLSLYFSGNHIFPNNCVHIAELSSNLSKHQRRNVVRDLASKKLQIVVSSDVATRGMDLENVEHVINFDVPIHIKTYLHRVGRTARAGHKGTGCTILLQHQAHHFRQILGKIDRTVTKNKVAWKEMNEKNIVEWSNLRESVMETVTCLQCCIEAESRRIIPSRKPLDEDLKTFLRELGKKYYGMSHGQSKIQRKRTKLMLDELSDWRGISRK